ncbi:MAG: UDP-2,3-diacylglucosamine diphosphatase [Bdellovibrionaceae bacterium]|nr:UDP-2,3-diacylglucosamine diphosphatase [Bdellovibrionales bacterium]MCB9085162.1 UDP-2,3-diacylglucosamine diphosphatase [Pseudobdellovibrionaceae bacterium]
MITSIKSDRLVVISDLHLGNPFSEASRRVVPFIRWAAAKGYDICINGDGLEIAQSSFSKIATQVPEFVRALGDIRRSGCEIYYIIGNHDILLEHFLEDWGVMKVSPFLNVSSGTKRIRIEHGHIYDPFFVKHPILYETLTHLAGIVLKVWPAAYRLWIAFEVWKSKMRYKKTGIVGEHPSFCEAAHEISQRGFDTIILGHTHHPGEKDLETGARYFNSGSWMISSHYIEIDKGEVSLREFSKETG